LANSGIFLVNDVVDLIKHKQFPSGDSIELIQTQNVTEVKNTTFSNIAEDEYSVHFMTISNLQSRRGSQNLGIRFLESGVLESGSVYDYSMRSVSLTDSAATAAATNGTYIRLDNTGSESWINNFYIYFYNLGAPDIISSCTIHRTGHRINTSGAYNASGTYMALGGGLLRQRSKVDGIVIHNSAFGDSATYSLYGIRGS
tara:strand:- start:908 stop:1507 length:600 start_codon:yes stop_codon:yes gene_type:complete